MQIQVLVVPGCPHERVAVERLPEALGDLGLADARVRSRVTGAACPSTGPRRAPPPRWARLWRLHVTSRSRHRRGPTGYGMVAPSALRAAVTGWKKVSPPEEQSPLPPEVSPIAASPSKSAPPLSPGSAQTVVSIRPETDPSW